MQLHLGSHVFIKRVGKIDASHIALFPCDSENMLKFHCNCFEKKPRQMESYLLFAKIMLASANQFLSWYISNTKSRRAWKCCHASAVADCMFQLMKVRVLGFPIGLHKRFLQRVIKFHD